MSAPSCRPRLVSAMSSAGAAATASSKNNSKKSPIRKNNRQPGWARLISWYCAMTGVAAAAVGGAGGPEGDGSASRKGSAVIGTRRKRRNGWRAGCAISTLTWGDRERATDDRDECSHTSLSGDPRGGRLVSRPRPVPQRRQSAARRRFRADRFVGARLAPAVEHGRG